LTVLATQLLTNFRLARLRNAIQPGKTLLRNNRSISSVSI
jgi:hypothetical protein